MSRLLHKLIIWVMDLLFVRIEERTPTSEYLDWECERGWDVLGRFVSAERFLK